MKQSPKLRPLFQNNTPLRSTKACRVQERHEVDLVSMVSVPATIDGDTYTCVMPVIDIFSRFVNLQKKSSLVAEHLLDIYNEHCPQEILQSGQGTEFKGAIKAICEALIFRIIYSAAYSPQTHLTDGCSHRTRKENKILT